MAHGLPVMGMGNGREVRDRRAIAIDDRIEYQSIFNLINILFSVRTSMIMTILLYRNIISKCNPIEYSTSICRSALSYSSNLSFIRSKSVDDQLNAHPLPSLPVPPLAQTVDRFLKFAKPIQSAQDHARTIELAQKFMHSEQTGKLQFLLEERVKKLVNWLTPWWLHVAYLSARTPLPVVTSPGITFPKFTFTTPGIDGQLECAAKIIQAALKYHHRILNDDLPVDRGPGGVPFDMSQYKLIFGTTRVPRKGKDAIRYGKDQPEWARHILVTRNGHTFSVPVYRADKRPLRVNELVAQLRKVIEQAEQPKFDAVNIVSSNDRETWASVYERLEANNPSALKSVEDALFVMALDRPFDGPEQRPEDRNMAMALHGGGSGHNTRNRWFDKTLQFNVNENGYGGITYEHTPAEGPPLAMLLDYICEQLNLNNFDLSTSTVDGLTDEPFKLEFKLDQLDKEEIKRAEERIDRVIQNLEVRSLGFSHFGKNIPKIAKFSPDSWIQVALQLTYYRLHASHAPAYETGSLRKFADGRTDTIRLPTMASKHFVEALSGAKTHMAGKMAVDTIFDLMKNAIAGHKGYSRDVMNGIGMDRHLLGLRMIAAENNMALPELFQSDIYQRLMHFLLSTSQVPTVHILPMGFGPSAPDCYGVCYNPHEHRIFFTITAFNECEETSAERFSQELERAMLDMRDLVDRAGHLKERAKL